MNSHMFVDPGTVFFTNGLYITQSLHKHSALTEYSMNQGKGIQI